MHVWYLALTNILVAETLLRTNNSASGLDGFTPVQAEINWFNTSLSNGNLTETQVTQLLTTLERSTKRKSHLRNNAEIVDVASDDLEWCPILHKGIVLDREPPQRLATNLIPNHPGAPSHSHRHKEAVPPIQHGLDMESPDHRTPGRHREARRAIEHTYQRGEREAEGEHQEKVPEGSTGGHP